MLVLSENSDYSLAYTATRKTDFLPLPLKPHFLRKPRQSSAAILCFATARSVYIVDRLAAAADTMFAEDSAKHMLPCDG